MALLKDLAPFLFNTGKKVETKAGEFKAARQGRCRNFLDNFNCNEDNRESLLYEEIQKARGLITEVIESLGLVSRGELSALKTEVETVLKKFNQEQ